MTLTIPELAPILRRRSCWRPSVRAILWILASGLAWLVAGCVFKLPQIPVQAGVIIQVYLLTPEDGDQVSWTGKQRRDPSPLPLTENTAGLETTAASTEPITIVGNAPGLHAFPLVENLRYGEWDFTITIASPSGSVEIECKTHDLITLPTYVAGIANVIIAVEGSSECSQYLTNIPAVGETHDVAITDLTVTPLHLIEGLQARVCATAINQGTVPEQLEVLIQAPGAVVPPSDQYPSRPPNLPATFSFNWHTTGHAGNFTVSATARPVHGEIELFDNSRSQPVTVSPADMVAHWRLDQLTPGGAPDSSPPDPPPPPDNVHNGTLVNGPSWVAGAVGNAVDFDGVDDFIAIPYNDELNLRSGNFTIAAWINPRTSGERQGRIIDHGGGGSGTTANAGWAFRLEEPPENRLGLSINVTDLAVSDPVVTFDNQWEHVAVARNLAGDVFFYRNGVQVGSATGIGAPLPQDDEIRIGNRVANLNTTVTDRTFDGLIDDVRIYNRPLNPNEIEAVYIASRHVACP